MVVYAEVKKIPYHGTVRPRKFLYSSEPSVPRRINFMFLREVPENNIFSPPGSSQT